jgi:hypothetical protein
MRDWTVKKNCFIGLIFFVLCLLSFYNFSSLDHHFHINIEGNMHVVPKTAFPKSNSNFTENFTYDLTLEFLPGYYETNETIYAPGNANLSFSIRQNENNWEYNLNYSVILDHPYEIIPIFLYEHNGFNQTYRANFTEIYMYVRGIYENQMFLNIQHVDHSRNLTRQELFLGNVSIFPDHELECIQIGFVYEITYLQDPNDPDYVGVSMMSGIGINAKITYSEDNPYWDEFDAHVPSYEHFTAETHVMIDEWNIDTHLEFIDFNITGNERWYNSTIAHNSSFGIPLQEGTGYLLTACEMKKSWGGYSFGINHDGDWYNEYEYTLPSGEFWRDYDMLVNYTNYDRDYLMIRHIYELDFAFDISYKLVCFMIVDDIAYEQFLKTLPPEEEEEDPTPEEPENKIPGYSLFLLLSIISISSGLLVSKKYFQYFSD